MCKIENIKRLEKIVHCINSIEKICADKGSITKALNDILRDKPAIFMFFININEQIVRIYDSFDKDIIMKFDENDIRGLKGVRNVIAHDYDGVDLGIIEDSVRFHLPLLKQKIEKILKEYKNK